MPAAVLAPDDVDRLRNAGKLHGDHLRYDMYNKVMMPLTGRAVSANMLQEHPKRVKRFLRAVEEGLAYTKEIPQIDKIYNVRLPREGRQGAGDGGLEADVLKQR